MNQQRVTAASDFFNKIDPERALKIDAMNGRYARKRSSAKGEGCVHQGDVVEDSDLMGDG